MLHIGPVSYTHLDVYKRQVLYYARSTDVEKDFKVEKTTLQSLVHAALKTYFHEMAVFRFC